MGTPFTTKVLLKIEKIKRGLDPVEREFGRVWPRIDLIDGWLDPAECNWLFRAARSLRKRSNIVEIGSYKGRSTCCLALGCQGRGMRVFAVDSFDGGRDLPKADSFAQFQSNINCLNLAEYVQPVIGLSTEIAKSWTKPIHLLFIDGSHFYEDVMADFLAFFPHVVPGGLVAFHDVQQSFPGVVKAWNEAFMHQLTRIGQRATLAYGTKPKQ